MTRRFDHIDQRVKDLRAATKFYRKILPALGFNLDVTQGDWCGFAAGGKRATEFFGLIVDKNHRPNGTRISFWAKSRAEVDRVAKVIRRAGCRKPEGPELCVDYTPGYYAFFFEDPDGNKLEVCHRARDPIAK